jgi:hypothetical protein
MLVSGQTVSIKQPSVYFLILCLQFRKLKNIHGHLRIKLLLFKTHSVRFTDHPLGEHDFLKYYFLTKNVENYEDL